MCLWTFPYRNKKDWMPLAFVFDYRTIFLQFVIHNLTWFWVSHISFYLDSQD